MFGLRTQPRPVVHQGALHTYLIHYVEHDRVMSISAHSIHDAVRVAREYMHRFNDGHDQCARPMYYADNTLCVIIYGDDFKYTCNIAQLTVHSLSSVPADPFMY